MTPLLRKLLGMNWIILILMLALAIFGVHAIYSCTHMREAVNYSSMWRKQTLWIGISFVIFLGTSLVDYRWARWSALPMYLVSILCLVLTLVAGAKIDGARCWLRFGPLSFQPAQLAAISGILIIALFLSQFRVIHPMIKLAACGLIAGAPMLLILLQPDLGSTLIWGPVVFSMLFIGRLPKRYLVVIGLLVVIAIPVFFTFALKPYQKARITSFLDLSVDPQGESWAVTQVINAVTSGGFAGKDSKTKDSFVEQGLVPQTTVPNDYIFAVVGEKWGFLGGVLLLTAFATLLGACLLVAIMAADDFGMLLSVGVASFIFAHTFQNIGMCLSMLPVTGIPLPLISYSGTFILVIMFSLGLVNSVWIHRKHTAGG